MNCWKSVSVKRTLVTTPAYFSLQLFFILLYNGRKGLAANTFIYAIQYLHTYTERSCINNRKILLIRINFSQLSNNTITIFLTFIRTLTRILFVPISQLSGAGVEIAHIMTLPRIYACRDCVREAKQIMRGISYFGWLQIYGD